MASSQRRISQPRLPFVYFFGLPTYPQLAQTFLSIIYSFPSIYIIIYELNQKKVYPEFSH